MKNNLLLFFMAATLILLMNCGQNSTGSRSIPKPVNSVLEGWAYAKGLIGALEQGDLRPISVLVDVGADGQQLSITKLQFWLEDFPQGKKHCWVTIDNRALVCRLSEDLAGVAVVPFPGRWIDIELIIVEIDDALTISKKNGGGELLARFKESPDLQIDLVLSPGEQRAMGGIPKHACVWAVSYDAWTSSGPQGFLKIEIDAESGELIETIDHR
jgi:hypothetical protein